MVQTTWKSSESSEGAYGIYFRAHHSEKRKSPSGRKKISFLAGIIILNYLEKSGFWKYALQVLPYSFSSNLKGTGLPAVHAFANWLFLSNFTAANPREPSQVPSGKSSASLSLMKTGCVYIAGPAAEDNVFSSSRGRGLFPFLISWTAS